MSWDDLGVLAQAGVEIGAHTITHPRLTRLKDEAAVSREIAGSRAELERRLGLTIPTFAYPYGDYDERVAQAVEAAGLSVAVTIDPESYGPLALGRIGIYGDEPFEVFVEKMTAAAK
jgi:peptidoglycan/xylan/chitin deacetylase (PgdA/CDA1 family)